MGCISSGWSLTGRSFQWSVQVLRLPVFYPRFKRKTHAFFFRWLTIELISWRWGCKPRCTALRSNQKFDLKHSISPLLSLRKRTHLRLFIRSVACLPPTRPNERTEWGIEDGLLLGPELDWTVRSRRASPKGTLIADMPVIPALLAVVFLSWAPPLFSWASLRPRLRAVS